MIESILAVGLPQADLSAGHRGPTFPMTHADELKQSGLKATLPRIKVLEVFQKTSQRHMSAEDVYRVLLAEDADVGLPPSTAC